MREYNKSVPAERRVKFVGFDIQHNETSKTKLLEYLRRVAPAERVSEAEELFKINLDDFNEALETQEKVKQAEAKLLEFQRKYYDLFMFMELTAPMIISLSSQAEYEQMRETARVLTQYAESYRYSDYRNVMLRDIYMADNIRRIASREPAGTRFVIWAHNLHIAEGGTGEGRLTSGYVLRKIYGSDYYALGFSFNKGAFQAREARPKDGANKMLRSFTVQPAPVDMVDWYLAQTGEKSFLVDFRAASKNAAITDWLAETRKMRSVGSTYDISWEQQRDFMQVAPGKEFDGLFFIDTTTRARPNPSVKNVAQGQ
jgi:erythromycin esterase